MDAKQPAEWEHHAAMWLAWPSHADLWGALLPTVQDEFTALCQAIAWAPAGKTPERLRVLVPNSMRRQQAQERLAGLPVDFIETQFGDIWVRDTGPIFLHQSDGSVLGACFQFNGWGGKYNLDHDTEVAAAIVDAAGVPSRRYPLILEGGSVEVDGEGTCLTTRQCLLNENRNKGLTQPHVEAFLQEAVGASKVLWLNEGLLNDHTDGHIDTLARFVAPAEVVCMSAQRDDPNGRVLDEIEATLNTFTDSRGRALKVHTVPSPGRVVDSDGKVLAASYVNYVLSNHSVIIPTYGVAADELAVRTLARLFPSRRAVGCPARALVEGGGAFHCITQQQPTPRKEVQ